MSAFVDDVIVSAPNIEIHNERLRCVLDRLLKSGLRVNKKKCLFAQSKITYLGYEISHEGIFKLNENENFIDFPVPKNVSDVRSFCGFVNFYGKFIQDLSSKMHPIYQLLKSKNQKIEWNPECEQAFQAIKKELLSPRVLCYYNPKLPIVLICDASNVGVAAIIAHEYPDKTQRPIEYASRVLSPAEQKYSIIEKEALAIIFGTKKFYQYQIGCNFTLVTDHRPLRYLERIKVSQKCLQIACKDGHFRQLSAFNYTIRHVKSADNAAELLSRLPIDSKCDVKNHQINYLGFVVDQI